MERALLLVDIQNDYFPGGAMELQAMQAAADNAARLLEAFRTRNELIIHVQHISKRAGAGFFLPGTKGAEIHHSVAPLAGEPLITKYFPNSFRDTGLADILSGRGIRQLFICGAMTHMCIDSTTRAAFDLGYRCAVAGDACATRELSFKGETISAPQVHGAFLAALGSVFAEILPTADLIGKL